MSTEPLPFVIARSSVGGYAWCKTCQHPDLNHQGKCGYPECGCRRLVRMTPEEWLAWKHPELVP